MIVHHPFLNDEVHLKIGGDHGGGSFKMSLQVVNTNNPNSKANTMVFSIFEAKDYRINIGIGLKRFHPDIKMLQQMSWRYYTLYFLSTILKNDIQQFVLNFIFSSLNLFLLVLNFFFTTFLLA